MSILQDNNGNPILEQFSEEGFIDCVLRISDLVETAEYLNFHLSASSQQVTLGFDVAVRKDIKSGFDSEMNIIKEHVYRDGVSFFRSGDESDRLIERLSSLYSLEDIPRKMVSRETFTAIALHQGDIDVRKAPIKIKIFGRDEEPFDENAYYESFFNLDISNGVVYWNEKDQDYRVPLIRGLTE